MLFKSSIAKYSVTIYGNNLASGFYQLATSAHDIVSVLANAATGPVAIRILDRDNGDIGNPGPNDFLVQAEASNSFEYRPPQPRQMKKGILISFEEGKQNAEVTIL